jgi:hypothetical protein
MLEFGKEIDHVPNRQNGRFANREWPRFAVSHLAARPAIDVSDD